MRAAFWLLALFAVATASALFAGNNHAMVTLFWPPHRIDISFNFAVLLLASLFLLLYVAFRAVSAVVSLPTDARRWRAQQKERAMYGELMDALAHLLAGRYIRAAKSAKNALAQESGLMYLVDHGDLIGPAIGHKLGRSNQLRALAHLLLAESAQSLQNNTLRDQHLSLALSSSAPRNAQDVREGVQLRAARWALDDQDADAALEMLSQLPQGVARRTLSLRLKLRAARLARQTAQALETARLLSKHRAFSAAAAQSLVRGLALELLNEAHDPAQLQQAWASLDDSERAMPELAVHAALRLMALRGDGRTALVWLLKVWDRLVQPRSVVNEAVRVKAITALEQCFESLDAAWLARIEAAQLAQPNDGKLQYLAGMTFLSRQLWGKAKQLLQQSSSNLQDKGLRRKAWLALATLAEQRDDLAAAAEAYKRAALI
jgi:HemY protein